MGLIPPAVHTSSFVKKLYDGFKARIKEVVDLKQIMYEIKRHKRIILKHSEQEKAFKVNIRLTKESVENDEVALQDMIVTQTNKMEAMFTQVKHQVTMMESTMAKKIDSMNTSMQSMSAKV